MYELNNHYCKRADRSPENEKEGREHVAKKTWEIK